MARQTSAVAILLALLCCLLSWFQATYQASLRFGPRAKLTIDRVSDNINAHSFVHCFTAYDAG